MNIRGLSEHFINGHQISDGFATGVSALEPDVVTRLKLPLLNDDDITAVSFNAGITATAATVTALIPEIPYNLRGRNPDGEPYTTLNYAVGPTGSLVNLTFNAIPFLVANTTAISFGKLKLFDLPRGRHSINGGSLIFTSVDWSSGVSFAQGTGAAGTAIAVGGSGDYALGHTGTADSTLGTTDVDIVASTAFIDPFVAGVGNNLATPGLVLNGPTEFNNSTTANSSTLNTIYLNIIVDDADVVDAEAGVMYLTGFLRFHWTWLGDF